MLGRSPGGPALGAALPDACVVDPDGLCEGLFHHVHLHEADAPLQLAPGHRNLGKKGFFSIETLTEYQSRRGLAASLSLKGHLSPRK